MRGPTTSGWSLFKQYLSFLTVMPTAAVGAAVAIASRAVKYPFEIRDHICGTYRKYLKDKAKFVPVDT